MVRNGATPLPIPSTNQNEGTLYIRERILRRKIIHLTRLVEITRLREEVSVEHQNNRKKAENQDEKMSCYQELNENSQFMPTKKLSEVEMGDYKVTKIRKVNTKFGPKVVAELEDDFAVFLTARVNKALFNNNEKMLEILSADADKGLVTLRYKGGKYHDMDFLGP